MSARLEAALASELDALARANARKGDEAVVERVVPAAGDKGPRYLLAGHGKQPFLRMNSNAYLGLGTRPTVLAAAHEAARDFGAGPGAVRFISGTFAPHVALEKRLARFHAREASMLFSSAYSAVLGSLAPLIDAETAVFSDALNHNCIINAIRLARPKTLRVYPHLDLGALASALDADAGNCKRAIVVTDGVFSMRGDHAPLDSLCALARARDGRYAEGVTTIVDDSHGVGALGASGRGTEEAAGAEADLLVATLGKAIGVNGGYVAASATAIQFLREKAATYIYSNPISPSEAAAALAALAILDSAEGARLLAHLRAMTDRFARGLKALGLETLVSGHPIVPLLVRDAARTAALARRLKEDGVLATAINYPVVPRGEEEIRFQVSADHTPADIDEALAAIGRAILSV